MNMHGESSYVDFGRPQNSAMKRPADLEWLYPYEDFFWSFQHSMVAFDTIDNAYDY